MRTAFPHKAMLASLSLAVATQTALADPPKAPEPDTQTTEQTTTETTKTTTEKTKTDKPTGDARDTKKMKKAAPKLGTAEVIKTTQNAMTHVTAAVRALDRGDKKAARSALDQSEQALARLYNAPALDTLMNEFDEAIAKSAGLSPADKKLDLAPLRASVGSYRTYIDPSVIAGVEEAETRANQGDTKAAAESLRLARERLTVDISFVPIEEAYIRVLAAKSMLEDGNSKQAARLLQTVPIVVSHLQISQPLVPIRLKLHAAAEAAEAEQWDRAKQLLSETTKDLKQLDTAPANKELAQIANEVERLHQQAMDGNNPKPNQIRQLAKRARSIGNEQRSTSGANGAG